MNFATRPTALAIAAAICFSAMAARADDRPPNTEERAAIEAALRVMGYSAWEEMELDDGVWEIDDAVAADGRKYDLKLRPGSLDVVEREDD